MDEDELDGLDAGVQNGHDGPDNNVPDQDEPANEMVDNNNIVVPIDIENDAVGLPVNGVGDQGINENVGQPQNNDQHGNNLQDDNGNQNENNRQDQPERAASHALMLQRLHLEPSKGTRNQYIRQYIRRHPSRNTFEEYLYQL